MRKYRYVITICFVIVCFIAGCSSDENISSTFTPQEKEPTKKSSFEELFIVQSTSDLSVCDSTLEGRAKLVQNQNIAYLCVKGVWRNAADSTDFSITCSDGFLHAVNKVHHPIHMDPDTVMETGYKDATFSGVAQKGPFVFGTSIKMEAWGINAFHIADGCIVTGDGRFALENISTNADCIETTVTGYYRNEVTGKISDNPITLQGMSCHPENSNVNILTHLKNPRWNQLVKNHVEDPWMQAERDIFAAFGIDTVQLYSQPYFADNRPDKPEADDLNVFGNSEYSAALFAISVMFQGDRDANEMENLMNAFTEDIKDDGIWNDPNWKIKIADWIVSLDSAGKFNDIRNNVSAWHLEPVPNFEKYMQAFIPVAYGFEACTDANAGQVKFVNQRQSALFADDYEHADHSTVRFICDANTHQWRTATAIEKDTAGFGPGQYDKEIREGRVNHNFYYIFETTTNAWRSATPQEADGFTDLVDVYASLKPDEKAVFIVRHSERTSDTSPTGHLTSNGKIYAHNLGERLAAIAKENFYYGYSGYTRTLETCEEIALGKGQQAYTITELPYLHFDWYILDEDKVSEYVNSERGGWELYSKYAFTGAYPDAFYDLKTRSEQLLKHGILANLSTMNRISFMCTHDYLVVPLLAYVTEGHANVRYYEKGRWINYLGGVAIIISADSSMRYIPVRGLETGTM